MNKKNIKAPSLYLVNMRTVHLDDTTTNLFQTDAHPTISVTIDRASKMATDSPVRVFAKIISKQEPFQSITFATNAVLHPGLLPTVAPRVQ